jgi:hypothetical protein
MPACGSRLNCARPPRALRGSDRGADIERGSDGEVSDSDFPTIPFVLTGIDFGA